jgi:hypothetical protein
MDSIAMFAGKLAPLVHFYQSIRKSTMAGPGEDAPPSPRPIQALISETKIKKEGRQAPLNLAISGILR